MLSVDEINNLQKENAELKAENARLKEQYNCYACGGCNGKEDYINLEKHHKGLRKQFDKYHQTLQEIKAIAKKEYDKKLVEKDCFDCDASFWLIINLITKAEEE